MPIDVDKYQEWTRSTAVYPGALAKDDDEKDYLTLGLCDEAGEVAGKRKKIKRRDPGAIETERQDVLAEVGDVLWYAARLLDAYDLSMESALLANMGKLESRKSWGTLKGSGDNR